MTEGTLPFELGGKRTPMQGIGISQNELNYTGGVPFPIQELTSTISNRYALFKYAIVSVTINNAIAFGAEVVVRLFIDSDVLAQYTIPTGQTGQVLYDTVAINKVYQNANNVRVEHGGILNGGGATNYTIRVTTFSTEV